MKIRRNWLSGALLFHSCLYLAAQDQPADKTMPTQFALSADIYGSVGQAVSRPMCANRPFTHDSPNWSVGVKIQAKPPSGAAVEDEFFGVYSLRQPASPGGGPLPDVAVVFLPVYQATGGAITVSVTGRKYVGVIETRMDSVFLVFKDLTLSETGDLVNHLLENESVMQQAFKDANLGLLLYRVRGNKELDDLTRVPATPSEVYTALYSGFDPKSNPAFFKQRLERIREGPIEQKILDRSKQPPKEVRITLSVEKDNPKTVSIDPMSLRLDSARIAKLREDVVTLSATGSAQDGSAAPGTSPIWVVDEPCLQLSVAPVLSGEESSAAATFRARYDVFSKMGKAFLRFRGEGDTASGGQFFQRVALTSDAGYNHKFDRWLLSLGATGSYNFARDQGRTLDEWKFGGKLQVYAPSLVGLIGRLPGAGSRPILNVEADAVGGKASPTKSTDFLGAASLLYTTRLSPRLSVDFVGSAGKSNKARFAERKDFAYARVQARFNLNTDWDYFVRYDCGRLPPDYGHFCGWQSGVALTMGR